MMRSRVLPLGVDMFVQIIHGTCVGIDDLFHILWAHLVLHPRAGACYQAFSLKLIRVEKISTQRFGIIGLIGDVRQDDDAGLLLVSLEPFSCHAERCGGIRQEKRSLKDQGARRVFEGRSLLLIDVLHILSRRWGVEQPMRRLDSPRLHLAM